MICRIVSIFIISAMALLSACNSSTSTAENPLILSTIKPIHSLVLAITEGTPLSTQQLLPDNASPHQYTVRPSDASALAKATVIIRVDAQFESPLDNALQHLKAHQQVLTLSKAQEMKVLPVRTLDIDDAHHDHDHALHEANDLHIWLDANNGIAMVKAIQNTLSTRFPEYVSTFQTNATSLIAAIQQADQKAQQQLSPFKSHGYITFHDAWQYFDLRYGVLLAGTISTGLGQQISAKHLQQLYKTIQTKQVKCLLYEPQFSQNALSNLANELNLKTTTLDDLGSTLTLSTRTYPELLTQAADRLAHCLQP
ncbi:MAG: hypothetical protein RLZZ422_1453 [Pseudomonadota bacterium]|jgi:zinc transport system substrate-binding protein